MKLYINILEHPADKVFPDGVEVGAIYKGEPIILRHRFKYKNGDVDGVQPRHIGDIIYLLEQLEKIINFKSKKNQ